MDLHLLAGDYEGAWDVIGGIYVFANDLMTLMTLEVSLSFSSCSILEPLSSFDFLFLVC